MALDSSNVRVAVTGTLSIGGDGFVAPTDPDTPLTGADDLGYFSEDGVTETRDRSTNTILGWQNGDVLREVVTEAGLTYTGTMVETKRATVELYYGTKVAADGSIVIVPAESGGRHPFVLDVIDGADFIRAYIPSGEVTEVGDQVYANGEPIGYEVTIRAYPDPSLVDPETGKIGAAIKWYSNLAVPAPDESSSASSSSSSSEA